ncbi:unnamed protein product [Cyprideis torosa]|uniref:Uncharacterized protein n=1 Tax=Cyprideis torosa TaxID=163714 RepID=A0A7R8ZK07_9CRUS|nr:unnamed protein product [Cyprideis torosa]CAG0879303.1 unnamed protein product [Cyprideis torosa]
MAACGFAAAQPATGPKCGVAQQLHPPATPGFTGPPDNVAILSHVHQTDDFECSLRARCAYGDPTHKEPGMKKLEFKGFFWHEQCFRCMACNAPIGVGAFIPRGQEVFCPNCYEETFSPRCRKCSRVITSFGVTYKNDPWHRECFTCTTCHKMLAEERFTSKNGQPFCASCFGQHFARRCAACGGAITGLTGTKYCVYEERSWHRECFVCSACKSPLIACGFVAHGAHILCPSCAKDRPTC